MTFQPPKHPPTPPLTPPLHTPPHHHSVALGQASGERPAVLQDILRLLTLWFTWGAAPDVEAALVDGFGGVSIDTWLGVIPQIIARIHTNNPQVGVCGGGGGVPVGKGLMGSCRASEVLEEEESWGRVPWDAKSRVEQRHAAAGAVGSQMQGMTGSGPLSLSCQSGQQSC